MRGNRIVVLIVCAWGVGCGAKVHPLVATDITTSPQQELVDRGRYLVNGPMHCAECHGATLTADGISMDPNALDGGAEMPLGPMGTIRFANITQDKATGIGAWSDADIARMVKHAQRPDGTVAPFMRLATGQPADDDVQAIVSYLRTVAPRPRAVARTELSVLGGLLLGGVEPRADQGRKTAPPMGPTVERGAYLVQIAHCIGCHSGQDGLDIKAGSELGGGEPMESSMPGERLTFVPPNLTPHATGIRGRWTEEGFIARFKTGRVHKGSPMAWNSFQTLTDDDIKAIWAYLGTVPPIDHDTSVTVIAP